MHLQGLHHLDLRSAQDYHQAGVLEVGIPGMLQGRQGGRVGFDRIGQLVQDQDLAAIGDYCRHGIP